MVRHERTFVDTGTLLDASAPLGRAVARQNAMTVRAQERGLIDQGDILAAILMFDTAALLTDQESGLEIGEEAPQTELTGGLE